MVLSIDEKSQIQALDRTQTGLPLKPEKCGTMTHDYKRNGTTTGALEDLQAVVAELEQRRADGEAALRAAFDFAANCTRGRNLVHPYNNYNPT